MTSKRGWLLLIILLAITIPTVHAAQPADCNNAGGIWCSNINECIYPELDAEQLYTCIITQEQNINLSHIYKQQGAFYFKDLTIQTNGYLKFYSQKDLWLEDWFEDYAGTGGLGGLWGSNGVNGGGFGGTGGDVGIKGQEGRGTQISCGTDKGAPSVSASPFFGGYVLIIAEKIVLNGVLDISGFQGTHGNPPRGHYSSAGCGGGGGSGGSGAGILILSSPNILGNGQIKAIGGAGGNGGKSNNNNGEQCENYGSKTNPGAAGGGGGGGAGGKIYFTLASIPSSIQISNAGGARGEGGCGTGSWAESGHPGKPGTQGGLPGLLYAQELCNNGVDDNYNGLIDMDDPDCHLMTPIDAGQAGILGWDTSIRSQYNLSKNQNGQYNTTWYNPSALDGTDLSCGDDKSYILEEPSCVGDFSFGDCSQINNLTLCSAAGCSSSFTASGTPTQCSSLAIPECSSQQGCSIQLSSADGGFCTGYSHCEKITNSQTCNYLDILGFCQWDGSMIGNCKPKAPANERIFFGKEITSLSIKSKKDLCVEISQQTNSIKWFDLNDQSFEGYCDGSASCNSISDFSVCAESGSCRWDSFNNKCKSKDSTPSITGFYGFDFGIKSGTINSKYWCEQAGLTWRSKQGTPSIIGWNGVTQSCQGTALSCSNAPSNAGCSATFNGCSSSGSEKLNCSLLNETTCLSGFECRYLTEATSGDLGFILPDQAYACFDNANAPGNISSLTEPGRSFVWRSADTHGQQFPYLISQVGNTHFISNNVEWNYCDASGLGLYGDVGRLSEGQSFVPEFPSGDLSCISTLARLNVTVGGQSNQVQTWNCQSSDPGVCMNEAFVNNKNAFCISVGGNKATYQQGQFMQQCGSVCYVHLGGSEPLSNWQEVGLYYGSNPLNTGNLCSELGIQNCQTTTPAINNNQLIDASLCAGRDVSACLPMGFDPVTSSCEQIISDSSPPFIAEDRLCSSQEYCDGGRMVFSSDNLSAPTCCYGAGASCKPFSDDSCQALGGQLLPSYFDPGQADCLGYNPEGTSCCIGGNWVANPNAMIGDRLVNESFVCYTQAGGNYLKECCGEGQCYNELNPLRLFTSYAPTGVYVLSGSRLHTIISFDEGQSRKIFRATNNILANYSLTNYLRFRNWSTFDTLEFDIAFNVDIVNGIYLADNQNNVQFYNLSEHVSSGYGLNRWLHVVIPLNKSGNFNFGNVSKLELNTGANLNRPVSFLLDEFVLSDSTGENNTENYYCTGDWKTWIKNLDGPSGDEGFFFDSDAPTLSQFGPYQYACDSSASFGWTGRLCCGDDTSRGQFGEFWADFAGACWNGTTVVNDQTFAQAIGSSNPTLDEKSLLFFDQGSDKKIWSCNIEANAYEQYNFSFDGINSHFKNFKDSITKVNYFSIKGSWMCQEGGWVNLNDVNRIRLVATALSDYAKEKGKQNEHTLFCGNYADLSNYLNLTADLKNVVQNACVLRLGQNKNIDQDKIIFGFEISKDKTLNDFSNVLAKFTPFNASSVLTCNGAGNVVESNKFFTGCEDIDTNYASEDFKFYYNRPFNLVVMSDTALNAGVFYNNYNFVVQMWHNFLNFFNKLFSSNAPVNPLPRNLTQNQHISDFYISYQTGQGNVVKQVVGVMEKGAVNKTIRIDYVNLNSDVSILKKAIESNYPGTEVNYGVNGFNQYLYIKGQNVDWKMATGLLRLVGDKGIPRNFGQQSQTGS